MIRVELLCGHRFPLVLLLDVFYQGNRSFEDTAIPARELVEKFAFDFNFDNPDLLFLFR